MQLLETIRFENGVFSNLTYHQSRMSGSRKRLFNCYDLIDLEAFLSKAALPSVKGLFKCRVIYDKKIDSVEFMEYSSPNITSLKIVESNDIEYSNKYLNRDVIDGLFQLRENADDIIIMKNNFVTDSSYANLLFYNGINWLTPSEPLLQGTQRAKLLSQNKIVTADIHISHIKSFSKVRLINAMNRFEDELDINISNIIY